MSVARHITRHRFYLAVNLLAAAGLVVIGLLALWGTKSPERLQFERIEGGMDRKQVEELLPGWVINHAVREWTADSVPLKVWWGAPNGATIYVSFDAQNRVTGKRFAEGDVSLKARMKQLAGRVFGP